MAKKKKRPPVFSWARIKENLSGEDTEKSFATLLGELFKLSPDFKATQDKLKAQKDIERTRKLFGQ